MDKTFLKKDQEYCKARYLRKKNFKMTQKGEESLDNSLKYLCTISNDLRKKLDQDNIRTIFSRDVFNESFNLLNLMGTEDVSKLNFVEIIDLCRRYSRIQARSGKGIRYIFLKFTKSTTGGLSRAELGHLIEIFKIGLLGTLSLQLDTLQLNKKWEDEKLVLSIFCLKWRKKHPLRECPLESIDIWFICAEDHLADQCPSLPRLKETYQESSNITIVYTSTKKILATEELKYTFSSCISI